MFILKNFPLLAQTATSENELLQLEVDDVCQLLADDMLNVREEDTAWEFVLRWIDHDPTKRGKHIHRLMKTVRFGLLNTEVTFCGPEMLSSEICC